MFSDSSNRNASSSFSSLKHCKQIFSRPEQKLSRRKHGQSHASSSIVSLESRVLLSGVVQDVSTDFNVTNTSQWQIKTEFNGALYFITNSTGQNALHRYTPSQGVEIVNLQYQGSSLDFGTGTVAVGAMANANGNLYFIATHSSFGKEVFKLDQNGVVSLAADLFVGGGSSNPSSLVAVGTTVYLLASGGNSSTGSPAGEELWRINSNGTTELVSDLNAGVSSSNISYMTVVGETLYFAASAGSTTGRELWKVDSNGQVVLVVDLQPGSGSSSPTNLTDVDGELYFTSMQRLWHLNADGRVTEIKSTTAQTLSIPTFLTNSNGTLYFTAQSTAEGRELWRITSNNQAELVVNFTAGTANTIFDDIKAVGNEVYVATTRTDVGRELWKVVPTGLQLVIDLNVGPSNASPAYLTNVNGSLYFSATDTTGVIGVWKINPSGDLQRLTTAIASYGFYDLFAFNDELIFIGSNAGFLSQYWSINNAGQLRQLTYTRQVSNAPTRYQPVEFNGHLYYNSSSAIKYIDAYGNEKTVATSMSLNNAKVVGQYLYFTSNGPTSQTGNELWRMDTAGTLTQVTDLNPDSGSSNPQTLTDLDGVLYFIAQTSQNLPIRLFRVTVSGAVEQVGDFRPRNLGDGENLYVGTSVNGNHFFSELQNNGTAGIWRLDPNGTLAKVSDLGAAAFYNHNGSAYFTASGALNTGELWRISSDGSLSAVADMTPASNGFGPRTFKIAHGTLYFTASNSTYGLELWKIDEFNNPVRVTDIFPGSGSADLRTLLVDTDETLYFTALSSVYTRELWKVSADGIPAKIAATTATDLLALHNGGAYFIKTISGQVTLWRIDLSTGNELQVSSIPYTGGSSGLPDDFYSFGDELIFTAQDDIYGNELWRINPDLTVELVKDFKPGIASGSPRNFFEFNDEIYFTVDEPRGTLFAKYTNAVPSASPVVADHEFTIPELSANGTVVGTVIASDPDPGQLLTYSIVDGNLSGAFEIDRYTGQIRVKDARMLNFEYGVPFKLRIEVKDNGQIRQSSYGDVTINLTNVDESPQLAFTLSGSTIVDGSTINLGRFIQYADQTFTLVVRNTGNFAAYLTGRQMQGSGLTITVPSNVNVLPGQTVTITVRVNSWLLGETDNTLNLVFQGGEIESSEYAFTFETEVVPEPQLELPTVVTPGTSSSFNTSLISDSVVIGNETFLVANAVNEIWKIDAAGELSRVVSTGLYIGIGGLAAVQGSLHFMATDTLGRFGIWKIDLSGNSVLVKQLTGFNTVIAGPNTMAEYAGRIYFVATDTTNGSELRALNADGSVELVADIYSGTGSSGIRDLTVAGNALYMSANNQLSGRELWRYTTTGGMELVEDLSPGTASTSPGKFVTYGGELYFLNNVTSPTATSTSTGIWKVNAQGDVELFNQFVGTAFINKVKLIGDSLYVQNIVSPSRVYEYNLLSGTSRTITTTGGASDFTVIDGRFFYTSGGSIYEWSEENGAWQVSRYYLTLTDIVSTNGAFYALVNSTFEGRELFKFTPHAPHKLTLSGTSVNENQLPATVVGSFTATDPDAGDSFVYSLVSGSGSTDNGAFTIVGNELRTKVSFDYEKKSSYTVRVRVADASGLFFEKIFTISVADLDEPLNVIDYGQPGYKEQAGYWETSNILAGFNGTATRYSNASNATVRWNTSSLEPGWYQVEFWNVAHTTNTTSATLTVQSGVQTISSTFNHATSPSGWRTIGSFYFDGTSSNFVQLSKSGVGYLRADAVRFTSMAVTVDNEDGSPSYNELTGTWTDSGNLTGTNGSTTRYSNNTNASVRWNTPSLVAGWYQVEFWNVAHGSNTTSATISVQHNGQTSSSTFNHVTTPAGWRSVGTFYFDGTASEFVQLSKSGAGYLRADAVRFTPMTSTALTINNEDSTPGYQEQSGTWATSSSLSGNEGSTTRFSNSTNASSRWKANSLAAGWYQVELWNVAHGTNTTSASVTVQHNGQTSLSSFNHALSPNGWLIVGTFYFDGSDNEFVQLSKSGSGYLRADAVKLTSVIAPVA